MPENLPADAPPGVAALVSGILEDAQKLVRQEIALARREVANAWDRAQMGVALILSAIPILIMGGILLVIMLVKLLHQYVLQNQEWACFAIVGGVLALLGGMLIFAGLKQLNRIRSMLPQTMEPLNPQSPPRDDGVSEIRPRTDTLLKR
jgi:putative superfamily III holin-X